MLTACALLLAGPYMLTIGGITVKNTALIILNNQADATASFSSDRPRSRRCHSPTSGWRRPSPLSP